MHRNPSLFRWMTLASVLLGAGGAIGCGADAAADGSDMEPVATSAQSIIPGATVRQATRVVVLHPGTTLYDQVVTCPAGSVPVGGGYYSPGNTRVFTSVPLANGWAVSVQNLSNVSSYNVTVLAECLTGTAATSRIAAPWSMLLSKGGSGCMQNIRCADPWITTAVGFNSGSSFRPYKINARASGNHEVCGTNENPGSSLQVNMYPLCLGGGVSGGLVTISGDGYYVAERSTAKLKNPVCESGLLLATGDYYVEPNPLRRIYVQGSYQDFQTPGFWKTMVQNTATIGQFVSLGTTCLDIWQ